MLMGCLGFEVVYIDIIGDLLLGTCVERMHARCKVLAQTP